jgi:hypothetical protein
VSAPNLDAYKAALGEAQKKLAEDSVNAFLFQLPNVTVADAKLKGLWKNAPIFVNDISACRGSERTRKGGERLSHAAVPDVGAGTARAYRRAPCRRSRRWLR